MHAHARLYIYLPQRRNLAVRSRDETDRELSPFSLTKCVAASSEKGEQLFKSISSLSTASSLLAREGPPAVDAGCYGNLEGQLQVSFASRMLAAKGGSLEGSVSRVPAAPGARHQSKFPRLRPASPASPVPWHPQIHHIPRPLKRAAHGIHRASSPGRGLAASFPPANPT